MLNFLKADGYKTLISWSVNNVCCRVVSDSPFSRVYFTAFVRHTPEKSAPNNLRSAFTRTSELLWTRCPWKAQRRFLTCDWARCPRKDWARCPRKDIGDILKNKIRSKEKKHMPHLMRFGMLEACFLNPTKSDN